MTAMLSGRTEQDPTAGSGAAGEPDRPDLSLKDLTKRFGSTVAVDGIDLHVPAGSYFALLGPSGCGKTTTLRLVAGLERPDAGTIGIGSLDVTGLRAHQRPVNTVFQSYALFPHLDVFDNVAFGLRRRRSRAVRAEVDAALELVQLEGLARRRPAQLSGGQQQRVALARAIVNRPAVLLLDEPLAALDLQLRRRVQGELKRIQAEVGLTFVHVTHDQEEALSLADTLAVMNDGRIEQLGAPQELYDRPRSTFAANFLGRSNLLPASVRGRSGDDLVLDVLGTRVVLPTAAASAGSAGSTGSAGSGALWLGLRPERLRLTDPADEPGPGRNTLPGSVVDVAFGGVSTTYRVRLAAGHEVAVLQQNDGSPVVARGRAVGVAWDAASAFGLDAAQDASAGIGPGA